MIMILYFSIIGGLFYKLFLKSPYKQENVIKSAKPVISKQKAADFHA
ncbi:hypothetical protein [Bacillus sp. FSL K6-3431]